MKESKHIISTQIRLGEDLYNYISMESERLAISMNAVMNNLMDEGRRVKQAKLNLQSES